MKQVIISVLFATLFVSCSTSSVNKDEKITKDSTIVKSDTCKQLDTCKSNECEKLKLVPKILK